MSAIHDLGARMDSRIDGVHTRLDGIAGRIDTLIDSISDVRAELAQHRHDD
jgi:hypothetical protein